MSTLQHTNAMAKKEILREGDVLFFKSSPSFTAEVTNKDGVLGFCSPFSGIWRPLIEYDLSMWGIKCD